MVRQTGTVSVLMAFTASPMPSCVYLDGYPVFKQQGLGPQPLPCIPQGQGTQCPVPKRASTHCFDFFYRTLVCPILELPIYGIIQYVLSCVQPL